MSTHTEAQGKGSRVTLEGTYSPATYFEETVRLEHTDYTATIAEGRIEVTFHEPEPLPDAVRQAEVTREVKQVFDIGMIHTAESPTLTRLTLKRYHPDGTPDTAWVPLGYANCGISVTCLDVILTDVDGKVVRDTKTERLVDERRFREQCLRHIEDPLLKGLIASYSRAVQDPSDRMTHLYEIQDALRRHFGGKKQAVKFLNLKNAWSELGRIANDDPIQESRHRGNHPDPRPATEEEHSLALDIARRMIRAYLDHLDCP